jgi:hypothetical protein
MPNLICFLSSVICELEPSVGEFGVYDLIITGTESGDVLCSMTTVKEPVNVYLREFHKMSKAPRSWPVRKLDGTYGLF